MRQTSRRLFLASACLAAVGAGWTGRHLLRGDDDGAPPVVFTPVPTAGSGHWPLAAPGNFRSGWSRDTRTLYMADNQGVVHGLESAAPRPVWRSDTRGMVQSPLVLAPGLVITAVSNGEPGQPGGTSSVVALTAATGAPTWSRNFSGFSISTPVLADGRLYCAGTQHLSVLDPATGRTIWSVPQRALTEVIGVGGGMVFAAIEQRIAAHDARDGRVRWTAQLGRKPSSQYTKVGRYLYAGKASPDGSHTLLALDLASGRQVWAARAGTDNLLLTRDLLIFEDRGEIHALDRDTGDTAWQAKGASPSVAGDFLYHRDPLAGDRFGLSARNPATGKQIWSRELPKIEHFVAHPDAVLVSGSTDPNAPKVWALNTGTGADLWSLPIGAVSMTMAEGRAFIADAEQTVVVQQGRLID